LKGRGAVTQGERTVSRAKKVLGDERSPGPRGNAGLPKKSGDVQQKKHNRGGEKQSYMNKTAWGKTRATKDVLVPKKKKLGQRRFTNQKKRSEHCTKTEAREQKKGRTQKSEVGGELGGGVAKNGD